LKEPLDLARMSVGTGSVIAVDGRQAPARVLQAILQLGQAPFGPV